MRKLLSVLLLAAFALSAAPKVPRKAPEFVIQSPGSGDKLLSSYRGKTVVLALMFTTCPHCQNIAKLLSTVQAEYASKGVQVLGATFDQGAAQRYLQFNQMFVKGFPSGISTQEAVLQFLEVPASEPFFVPILAFIDKTGTLRSQYIGDEKFLSNPDVNIRAEIDKMLKLGGAAASQKK